MKTEQKIKQFIEKKIKLLPPAKLIVGISGGADSVVLLHLLKKMGYTCIAAHCNFHLRGIESDRDELFVTNFTEKLDIPLEKIDFYTTQYAKEHKISIEMAARDLRYHWFEDIRLKQNAVAIAVAHHADDSIETFLMNLIRGSGLKGLKGIEPVNGKIIRPLLAVSRKEIETYSAENELSYVTDSTNQSTLYLRNKIRLELLPMLAELNPSIRQTLAETIERMQDTWSIFNGETEKVKKDISFEKEQKFYIDINKLKALQGNETILFEILQDFDFNSDTVKNIIESLDKNSGLKFFSSKKILIKDRNFLIISDYVNTKNEKNTIDENCEEISFPVSLKIKKIERNENYIVSKKSDVAHIDIDKLKFPLTVRKWKNGDTFIPFGMKKLKKVSDFLINEKVNIIDKENIWVVESAGIIVWIVGMRIDGRFSISKNSKNILELSFLKH